MVSQHIQSNSVFAPVVSNYQGFLDRKTKILMDYGFEVSDKDISSVLFPFQKAITRWGLKKGKCAYFAGTGLGKTLLQLEFAKHAIRQMGGEESRVIVVAPLGVTAQTQAEAKKLLGIDINICRERSDLRPGINITNYERLNKFEPEDFQGTILDESSILKGYESKFRKFVNRFSASHQFKLACSATPAPNDYLELLNHAEWLDVMTRKEAIALFFIQDGNSAQEFRLKRHAIQDFWRWVASWAIAVEKPSDLDPSFDDAGYILPPLNIKEKIIAATGEPQEGFLFQQEASTLTEQRQIRRDTLSQRVDAVKEIVESLPHSAPVLVWCELNTEGEALRKALAEYGAKEVKGADKPELKEETLNAFSSGDLRILITKSSIAGFGLNWQHCQNMLFLGASHSMEQTYQAIRRCWRYGQKSDVNVWFIRSELDAKIYSNFQSKEKEYKAMMSQLIDLLKVGGIDNFQTARQDSTYNPQQEMILPNWI